MELSSADVHRVRRMPRRQLGISRRFGDRSRETRPQPVVFLRPSSNWSVARRCFPDSRTTPRRGQMVVAPGGSRSVYFVYCLARGRISPETVRRSGRCITSRCCGRARVANIFCFNLGGFQRVALPTTERHPLYAPASSATSADRRNVVAVVARHDARARIRPHPRGSMHGRY